MRGALMLLFLALGLGLGVWGMIYMTFVVRSEPELVRRADGGGPYLPLLLLVLFLQTVLGKNAGAVLLHFSPTEVELLFPAPFRRRDLLLYKLWQKGIGLIVVALMMSMTPISLFFRRWVALFVGLTLTLAFLNLAGLAVGLLRLIVAERAYTRVRKVLLTAMAVLAAVALPQAIARTGVHQLADLADSFRLTWPGQVLLAPFEVFSRAMLAERWFPDLVGWAGAAAAIDLGLVLLILRLDADYLEWSATFSQWIYDLQQRARKGGGFAIKSSGGEGRSRWPALPWLGGGGPLARNQLLQTGRKTWVAMRTAAILAIAILIWNGFSKGQVTAGVILGLLSYIAFLLGTAFPLAFRGDLAQMDLLKTLPIRPLALAMGELGGCAAVISGFQAALLAAFAPFVSSGAWSLLAAAILVPAINWLLLATSNLFFLLYPVSMTPASASDPHVMGRGCLVFLLQMSVMLVLLGLPAGLAGLAYLASGFSRPVMVAVAFVALWVEAVPMTLLVTWAFDRFDPSLDMPA